ncbi:MAG: glycogen debranching N-terminal domain-containing protein, partial [Actinomycetota bacterium]
MTTTGGVVDIREVQVIKDDRTFLVTDRFGDISEGNTAALGLYHMDTRFLSGLELVVNDVKPLLLHSSTERNYSQIVELTYPFESIDREGVHRKENVSVQRHRVLSGSLFERIRVRNFGTKTRSLRLTIDFAADFLDIFEVRGLFRERRGQIQPARIEKSRVTLSYRGLDGGTRSTTLRFSPAPEQLDESSAVFSLEVEPGQGIELVVEAVPQVEGTKESRATMQQAEDRLGREYTRWRKRCTRFNTSNVQLSQFLDRAILDLRMLTAHDDEGTEYIDAGIPWYSALFGRDALITAYQALAVNTDL